jgi:hypothetical protein
MKPFKMNSDVTWLIPQLTNMSRRMVGRTIFYIALQTDMVVRLSSHSNVNEEYCLLA